MSGPVTHLVISDWRGSYEPTHIVECRGEVEAEREYTEALRSGGDVRLVRIERQSTSTQRRVAESVDQ